MPELPEVETVRQGLLAHAAGRTIDDVTVLHPRPVRYHPIGPEAFRADLAGRRIDDVRRRGKYLWAVLGDDALVAHLGMSGQFRFNLPGDEHVRNTRVLFHLDDGTELRFVDQRTFGGWTVVPLAEALDGTGVLLPAPAAHIASDPFEPGFDAPAAARVIRRRDTEIKRLLLDQTVVSGIGNIYADEALWRSGVHGRRRSGALTLRSVVETLEHARDVMADALEAGGTSFDALYVNVNGASGYFDRSLDVYGRAGLPCARCGTPVVREEFMNRGSHFCPGCQVPPRRRAARRAVRGSVR